MKDANAERYPIKANRHSSHSQILKQCGMGNGRRLLDVGCARGHLSAALAGQGWNVTGIEYDASDASIAQEAGIDVIVGTAEDGLSKLNEQFDVIIFADVLEHLVHPLAVLQQAHSLLAPGGRIIISVPNVAHITVRLQLLFGSFTYTDRGILDRTHIHFYTRKTLKELVTDSGMGITYVAATPAPIEEVVPVLRTVAPLRVLLEFNALVAKLWKSAFAYQYIVVAKTS